MFILSVIVQPNQVMYYAGSEKYTAFTTDKGHATKFDTREDAMAEQDKLMAKYEIDIQIGRCE